MTRNRFNPAKQDLSKSKAHQLFLEDIENIVMKDTYKNNNMQPPSDEKE